MQAKVKMQWAVKSLISSIQTVALTLTMFQLKVCFDQFLNISNTSLVTNPRAHLVRTRPT